MKDMNKTAVFILAAGFVLSAAGAPAVDFKVKGEWDFYFNFGETTMYKKPYAARKMDESIDAFQPVSRIRLQMEAAVSENLSGVLQLEIGNHVWGRAGTRDAPSGASMGERGASVKVKRAHMDWQAPDAGLRCAVGLQGIALPNAAGGSAVLDEDTAAVAASWKVNDHASLAALWARPYNDNYVRGDWGGRGSDAAFDNLDLGMLAVPLTFDGFSAVPWAMFGMMGKNAVRHQFATGGIPYAGDYIQRGLFPADAGQRFTENDTHRSAGARFTRPYAAMFWAGIPIRISAFDPFNIEFDVNYGYVGGFGRYNDARAVNPDGSPRRNDSRREGFVLKALVEHKTDWGIPGVFGWYGSGDSGNTRNGSGRMPCPAPAGDFSSFGLAGYYGDFDSLMIGERVDAGYSGTWAVGAQIKDLSFLEGLSHDVRIIYRRGANDPAMAKALRDTLGYGYDNTAWNRQPGGALYLTRNDYLVEFNLDSACKISENLEARVELGYIVNGVDRSTWKWSGNQKEDAWKVAITMRYSF